MKYENSLVGRELLEYDGDESEGSIHTNPWKTCHRSVYNLVLYDSKTKLEIGKVKQGFWKLFSH